METLQGFETWFFPTLISLLLIIIGVLLTRTFNKMESMMEKHDDQLQDHETRLQIQEVAGETLKTANAILAKVRKLSNRDE